MAAAVAHPPAVLADYLHEHFQGLPTLEEAKAQFLEGKDGERLVTDVFKAFFVKEGMERRFGLAMLHRHFPLEANEKLVDYHGTSTPWVDGASGMKAPQPTIWAFDADGVLRPTEFHYSEGDDAPVTKDCLAFFGKFKTLLESYGLTSVLGLSRYPGDDFEGSCEITHGRANINLKPKDVSEAAPRTACKPCISGDSLTNISILLVCSKLLPSGSSLSIYGHADVDALAIRGLTLIRMAPTSTP